MAKPKSPAKKSAGKKTAARGGKGEVLARRALSTVVLWGLVAAALATDSALLFYVLITVVGTLACGEFLALLGLRGTPGWAGVSLVAVICSAAHLIAVAMGSHLGGSGTVGDYDMVATPLLMIGITVALLFHPIQGERTRDMFLGAVFGFVYTAVLASFMIRILFVGNDYVAPGTMTGAYYLLFLLVVTKFADMGAYVVGTLIGKHKLIPHISPGKTWEGILLGAFPFAIGGGCLIYQIFGDRMPVLNWTHVLVLGALLAAVAIVGDLAESVLKRSLAKKDSGSVLPGIGGVLDLVDSLLFTAPVLFIYLQSIAF